jgi:hypothetical protein
MCDPGTAIALGSAAFGAVGSIAQGQAQAAALERQAATQEANAAIARNNAIAAVQAAEAEADRVDRVRKIQSAKATAAYGKSGVEINEGTPIEVLGDVAAEFELEKLFQIHKGKVVEQDQNYRAQLMQWHAGNLRSSASSARSAGFMKAIAGIGTSVLSAGFSSMAAANPTLGFGASQSQLAGLGYDVSTFSGYNPFGVGGAFGTSGLSSQATYYNTLGLSSGMGYE